MTLTINKACKQALLLGERPEVSREPHTKGNACAPPLATRFTCHSKRRACSQAAINIVRRIKYVSPKTPDRKHEFANIFQIMNSLIPMFFLFMFYVFKYSRRVLVNFASLV